jgi:hypothetical protein
MKRRIEKDFAIPLTEEFLKHCSDGSCLYRKKYYSSESLYDLLKFSFINDFYVKKNVKMDFLIFKEKFPVLTTGKFPEN